MSRSVKQFPKYKFDELFVFILVGDALVFRLPLRPKRMIGDLRVALHER